MGMIDDLKHVQIIWDTSTQTIWIERFIEGSHDPKRRTSSVKVSFDETEITNISALAREQGYNELSTFLRDEVLKVYFYVYAQSKNYQKYVKDEQTIRQELFDCLIKNSRK